MLVAPPSPSSGTRLNGESGSIALNWSKIHRRPYRCGRDPRFAKGLRGHENPAI
jgi:hypothetical protein